MEFDWSAFRAQMDSHLSRAVESLEGNFGKIYAARVSPNLVSGVPVEAYGSEMKLFELANVSVPSARVLNIKPYDPSLLEEILKSLRMHRPEFSPSVQGDQIVIALNPPTEETRRRSVRDAKEFLEQSKIAVRNVRKDFIAKLKGEKLSQDLEKKHLAQIEQEIKNVNLKLDGIFTLKEKEIMTI